MPVLSTPNFTRIQIYLKVRKTIHGLLHTHDFETKWEHFARIFLASLILFSIVSVMLETEEDIYVGNERLFYYLELVIVIIFSAEYILRVWSIVEETRFRHPVWGRLRYVFSFLSLIDLLAILPFYVPKFIVTDLRFLRGIRLVRLFRVIKLTEYTNGLDTISTVLHKKRHELQVVFLMILLLLLISSSLMYFLEHSANPHVFKSIPSSLWWGVCTLTTIGYSAAEPITFAGRFFTAVVMLLGISSFALPSGIIISGLLEEMEKKRKRLTHCPHCEKELLY